MSLHPNESAFGEDLHHVGSPTFSFSDWTQGQENFLLGSLTMMVTLHWEGVKWSVAVKVPKSVQSENKPSAMAIIPALSGIGFLGELAAVASWLAPAGHSPFFPEPFLPHFHRKLHLSETKRQKGAEDTLLGEGTALGRLASLREGQGLMAIQ